MKLFITQIIQIKLEIFVTNFSHSITMIGIYFFNYPKIRLLALPSINSTVFDRWCYHYHKRKDTSKQISKAIYKLVKEVEELR